MFRWLKPFDPERETGENEEELLRLDNVLR